MNRGVITMDGTSKLSRYLMMLDRLYQRGDKELKDKTLETIHSTIKQITKDQKAAGIMDELSYTSVLTTRLNKLYKIAAGDQGAA